jgi:predicted nucleic acid-binding protein
VGPTLFLYEVVAVLRNAVYQERVTPEQGKNLVRVVLVFPIRYHQDSRLFERAYEFATEYNRPRAYDSCYLALAESIGCDFWTVDERLVNVVNQRLDWVRWLNDFKEP